MYEMTTISSGTRIRQEPNTAGSILTSVNANVTVKGTELFVAPVPLSNTGGVYQFVGDKWLKVSYNGVTGWMAYIHKGEPICDNFRDISETPEQPTPPSQVIYVFPDWYDMVAPDGTKQRFVKS